MKICHCGFKFTEGHREPSPSEGGWQAREVWICGTCGNLSHAIQDPVAVVRGPSDSNALLHAVIGQDGSSITTWSTPRGKIETIEHITYPRKVTVEHIEPRVFTIWNLLMGKVEVILAEPKGAGDNALEAEVREQARKEARGLAEALHILMKPFMASTDAVVKAAVKKHKDPTFEVPGLGTHLWDPLKNADGSWRTPISAPKSKPRAVPKSSKNKLDPDAVAGIKEALSSGMFDKPTVAEMFKVSMETLEEALQTSSA
jgi:hypothetical protein